MITFIYIVQVRNMFNYGTNTNINYNNKSKKKEPLVNWSEQEVEELFLSTKYKHFVSKFQRFNGRNYLVGLQKLL